MTRRIERINNLIRLNLSEFLQRHIKDPRLSQMVAITEVVTTSDLRHAKVFVSCFCNDKEKEEILRALASASGFLRTELCKRLDLRRVPDLTFQWDESIKRGAHILELIDRVSSEKERKSL